MPPDFLNSREDAILVWAVVILAYALSKDLRGIGGSLLSLAAELFRPKILLLYGSALVYSGLLVFGASRLGLWHMAALKATAYWFIGVAVILVADAVVHVPSSFRNLLGRVFRRLAALTILIEFAVNLYALPLGVELMLLPPALLAGVHAVTHRDALSEGVLAAIGLVYIGNFVARALADLDALLSRSNAEELLVGPVLTVALIPLLFAAGWWSRREQEALRRRFRVQLPLETKDAPESLR